MKTSKSTISSVVVRLSLVAALGMALGHSSTAAASLITWQTPVAVNISNPAQVVNHGLLVTATDITTAHTINGVTFSPTNFGTAVTNYTAAVGEVYGPNNTTYTNMLAAGAYRSSGGTANIAISSLTIGYQYEVQIFTPFWDANYESKFSDGANSVNMGNTQSAPTFVIGTFMADAVTKNISFEAASGSSYGLLSAFQVRLLPEPGSLTLLSMGAVSLVAMARRRKRRSAIRDHRICVGT